MRRTVLPSWLRACLIFFFAGTCSAQTFFTDREAVPEGSMAHIVIRAASAAELELSASGPGRDRVRLSPSSVSLEAGGSTRVAVSVQNDAQTQPAEIPFSVEARRGQTLVHALQYLIPPSDLDAAALSISAASATIGNAPRASARGRFRAEGLQGRKSFVVSTDTGIIGPGQGGGIITVSRDSFSVFLGLLKEGSMLRKGEALTLEIFHLDALNPSARMSAALSAGASHNCIIRTDNRVECWGRSGGGQSGTPQDETFLSVSSGVNHTCGIRTDGIAQCWGDNSAQQFVPGNQILLSLDAGTNYTCGIRTDNRVKCWGDNSDNKRDGVPAGETFLSVSAGGIHNCGVTTDRRVRCWGSNNLGRSTPPPGETFLSVSAGSDHTCGVTTDRRVRCWGSNNLGQAAPPSDETFLSVSAGSEHSCGITAGSRFVRCWGGGAAGTAINVGQATVPDALRNKPFLSVSTGSSSYTCAVTADGAAACWGSNWVVPERLRMPGSVRISPDTPWRFEKSQTVSAPVVPAVRLRIRVYLEGALR